MDTKQLKSYAPEARRDFIEAITNRAAIYGLLPDEVLPMEESGDVVIIGDQAFPRAVANQRRELEKRVAEQGFDQFIEAVAYTWFNRLVAIRYMEVHGYLDHGYRVLSHPAGESLPEVMEYAERLDLPGFDSEKVIEMKLDGQKDGELYRLILVAQCIALHRLMPFMFGSVSDASVLLLPENLLNTESVVRKLVSGLPEDSLQDVEAVGWLYQFYISEKKDAVFEALKKKKKKITPENIPAATQLFTPHWIVRYLVENSLGRLWMLNHPDSKLFQNMKDRGEDCYFIEPEEPETDFLRINRPEEIKICDPACGSGHMLTYAFDLLYAIYEEQGYRATDIPKLIFENNLYGIEIDDRAGALAAFALTMKAREKNRRFLNSDNVVQPNICVLENIAIDPDGLEAYMDKVGRDLFSDGLQGVVNQWKEAKNFGSLIRPLVTDVAAVLGQLRAAGVGEDLFLNKTHQKVLKALRQADYLSPKYHVVVANPPYMGRKSMNLTLKKFAQSDYADNKLDVFAMFIERCCELSSDSGYVAMITMQSWMFLSSYEELREHLLTETTIQTLAQFGARAFDTIGGGVVSTAAFVTKTSSDSGYKADYLQLTEGESEAEKQQMLLERHDLRYKASSSDFARVDGSPISYWLPDAGRSAFERGEPIEKVAEPRQGMATTDNNQFLRLWYEVSYRRIGFGCESSDAAKGTGKKWFPYNKGGSFRKWYGNLEYVVNYENDGDELKSVVKEKYREKDYAQGFSDEKWDKLIEVWVLKNQHSYFLPSLTWSFVSSSAFGVRRSDAGFIFDVGGSSAFPPNHRMNEFAAYLCSKVAFFFMSALNPTLNFQVENVAALPVIDDAVAQIRNEVSEIAESAVAISRQDWNANELSWDFTSFQVELPLAKQVLETSFAAWRESSRETVSQLQRLEEENNRHFIEAYDLSTALTPEVDRDQVTLNCNPYHVYDSDKSEDELEALLLADTMREFISYAVGCMLGRYSLDKPGLILANQGETADDYRQQIPEPTFAPDEDNVIPLLDGDWFTDDISERFKEFLKVTFGPEHYDENLAFLENSLYPDNETARTRKTILDYFTKDFFKHHMKMYKKRPIYWLFSSGKQGAFRALIYMHRYNPSTLSRMRTAYVVPLQGKYNSRIDQLANDIPAATSTSHRKQLEKEHASFIKKRDELQTFDEKLRHYADQRIAIDLDDGVKENYSKFGDLLANVKDITGRKPVTT